MTNASPMGLPRHVGIIMDGNGRWARGRGLPRVAGHKRGARTVDEIVTACRKSGIPFLTLYAFSAQNWGRPGLEIRALMELLAEYIRNERTTLLDNNIRLNAIGQLDMLPSSTRTALQNLVQESAGNTGMTLTLALSYGGREEIVAAARTLATKVRDQNLNPTDITLTDFESCLWSADLGPLDLVIRTSGEQRISNFMLWSCAYSEFYFCEKRWPDFTPADLERAFTAYKNRHRRFGDIDTQCQT